MNYLSVGTVCKIIRVKELNKTLKEFSNLTGLKIPTISSFENDRSRNMEILILYFKFLDANKRMKYFNLIIGSELNG